jgi:hypothetical protein
MKVRQNVGSFSTKCRQFFDKMSAVFRQNVGKTLDKMSAEFDKMSAEQLEG